MTWQKYLLALVVTVAIFGTAFYIATRFNDARIADIRATESTVSIDILSTETQFELLSSVDCSDIGQSPELSSELNDLAAQLSAAEENLGDQNADVISLKEQYSLLEIKDYLLMQEISQKCSNFHPVYILYFYSNAGDCTQCDAEGDVLTYLRETYPGLRVYSFDYNLDLSALETLESLRNIKPTSNNPLPAVVVNDRTPIYGFKDLQDMENLVPELKTLASSTSATSTTSTTTVGY